MPFRAVGRAEGNLQALGIEPEGDVDRVRLEEEVVLVGDERDLGPLAGQLVQIEGGLEAAEAAAEDDNAGAGRPLCR